MPLNHGINTFEVATSVGTPVVAESGVPFCVGVTPVWHGTAQPNEVRYLSSWAEAVEAFGYSEDWDTYPGCGAMDAFFRRYGMAPMLAVCPFDYTAAGNSSAVAATNLACSNRQVKLPIAAIPSTVVVKSPSVALSDDAVALVNGTGSVYGLNLTVTGAVVKTASDVACTLTTDYTITKSGDRVIVTAVPGGKLDGETSCKVTIPRATSAITYASGTDYELYVDGEYLVVEALSGGDIYGLYVDSLNVAYSKALPASVTSDEVAGGYNATTGKNTGLETIEECLPKYGIVPDLILCPGWSHDSTVAALMATKAEAINGLFPAVALIDVDAGSAVRYDQVPAWKTENNVFDKQQYLLWPNPTLGERTYKYSAQMAGLIAKTDEANGGCPVESPSNKLLKCDGLVDGSGNEITIQLAHAEYLNNNGVCTVLSLFDGFRAWGDETACYPGNTDVKDYEINMRRMFGWIAKTTVRTLWSKLDRPMTPILVQAVQNTINDWLSGLVGKSQLLGARVEFLESENPTQQLMTGHGVFHVYITPPPPFKRADFLFEFDTSYLSTLFQA